MLVDTRFHITCIFIWTQKTYLDYLGIDFIPTVFYRYNDTREFKIFHQFLLYFFIRIPVTKEKLDLTQARIPEITRGPPPEGTKHCGK